MIDTNKKRKIACSLKDETSVLIFDQVKFGFFLLASSCMHAGKRSDHIVFKIKHIN